MSFHLCMVGYGAMAREYTPLFKEEGAILDTVVGRVSEDTARFADQFGFLRHTTDLDAALADEKVRIVVITSPSAVHYKQAKRSLLAGKDTLVEIPLAMSYSEAAELVELAQKQGRILMVAHSQRFIPSLVGVQAKIKAGELHVYHLVARMAILRRHDTGWTGRRRSWTDNLLWHHGCHFVDFALWLLGYGEMRVEGQIAHPDPRTGTPLDLDLVLRTPAEQLVALSLSYNSHMEFHEYLIIGEEDTVHYDRGRLYGPEGLRDDPYAMNLDADRQAWKAQNHEFMAAIQHGRQPAMSGLDALPALKILQEVQDRFLPGAFATQAPVRADGREWNKTSKPNTDSKL